MPAWIHDRAQHLLAKNPKMEKSQAFAIATQQSHALGKSPKRYGTKQGRRYARDKYGKPKKQYKKTPNPGGLETPKLKSREKIKKEASMNAALRRVMLAGMHDELMLIEKNAGMMASLRNVSGKAMKFLGGNTPQGIGGGASSALGVQKQMAQGRFKAPAVDPMLASRMKQSRKMQQQFGSTGIELG